MKAKEILRRYAAGKRDFRNVNLRGQSFRGQDLSGANFSGADIRGTDFTNALLREVNFVGAKAGVQKRWMFVQVVIAFVLSVLLNFTAVFISAAFTAYLLTPEGIQQYTIVPGFAVLLVNLVTFGAIARQGLTAKAAATIAIVVAVAGVVAAAVAGVVTAAVASIIAVVVASVVAVAGAVAVAVAGAVAGAGATVVVAVATVVVAVAGAVAGASAGIVTGAVTGAVTGTVLLFSFYIAQRVRKEDDKFALARLIGVAFGALGGTSFRGADLTGANFTRAILKNTNFNHKTNLTRVCWNNAKQLNRARVGNSILANRAVQELLVTCNGYRKSYIDANLRSANLNGVSLNEANLRRADLSRATLRYADLHGADLSETLLLGADFTGAHLTGACIEAWNIDSNTGLDQVDCQYVYLLRNQQERRPSSGNFAPGEFTKLFQEILNTVDLIFSNGMDWKAFVVAFQQVQVENEYTHLEIQSIENKGDGVVVVRVNVPLDANKAKIHSEFNQSYDLAMKVLEAKYQAQLRAREEQIDFYRQQSINMQEVIKVLASRPVDVNFAMSSEAAGTNMSINVGGNVSGSSHIISNDSNQTITISAGDVDRTEIEIQTAMKFLEQTGATVNRKDKYNLEVADIQGKLSSHAPLPVLFTTEQPKAEDVIQLVQQSEDLASYPQKRAGIIIYVQPPESAGNSENTLFWMKMTEVRLRDNFILIPIPFAAVDRAFIEDAKSSLQGAASKALLAEYTDRYMPGADLFNDRNAIGDTLTFFGRDEILHRLQEELRRNQGIGLFGLRKSGKTSLLVQLGFSMRRHPVIHIDLQPYSGKVRYGAELFNQILQQLLRLAKEFLPDTTQELMMFDRDQSATELTTDFSEHFSNFVEVLIEAGYEMPILVFLDEIERILPSETDSVDRVEEFNALFGVLRALSQEQRKISLLVADVHPDCNRINQWKQNNVPTNPVFNFFKEFFLSPFSQDETTKMLIDIGKIMGLSFDEKTLLAIHKESGGHPFLSRQLASLVYNKVSRDGNKQIEWLAAQRYIEKPFIYSGVLKDYFGQNIWNDLEKRNLNSAITILRLLACSEISENRIIDQSLFDYLKKSFTESQCLDALLWLEKVGLVNQEELENGSSYKIQVSLLSLWIRIQMNEDEIRQWQIQ